MTFFNDLDDLLSDNVSLNLSIARTADGLVVTVLPKVASSDEAVNKIPPMVLKGTCKELDDNFFDAISTPIKSTTDFFDNIVDYEKGLEKAAAESKIADAEKKKKQEEKEKKKKVVEKAVKGLKEKLDKEDFVAALKICDKLDADTMLNKEVNDLYEKALELKKAQGQVDIFDVIEEETSDESGEFEKEAAQAELNNEENEEELF